MKDFDTALAEILAEIPGPLAPETISLNPRSVADTPNGSAETFTTDAILGRVLARDIDAQRTNPPMSMSAMDGYAVRASDLPGDLRGEREIAAGTYDPRALGTGEAVRIFTGAPLPPGADTIAIEENAAEIPGGVRFEKTETTGRFVRPAGLDFHEGDRLAPAGAIITPRLLALLAAGNNPTLPVVRRPRVAVLTTGDEIRAPGDPLGPAQIVSSNNLAVAAMARACGADATDFGSVGDNLSALEEAAARLHGFDVVVTTGGASVGKHDLVAQAFQAQGLELGFWKIAMRPGKPLIFGRFGGGLFLGLPGNPVSALILSLLVLRPVLAKLQGQETELPRQEATLAHDLPANDLRRDFIRACRQPDGSINARARQDSSMLSVLAAADVILDRPANDPPLRAGDTVKIIDLSGLDTLF